MEPSEIEALFTGSDGVYRFARWGREVAPNVFGVEDETLEALKAAMLHVLALADRSWTEVDSELGSNLMLFFFRDWAELLDVPDLDRLVPGLADLVDRVQAAGANQYRVFRFDQAGAICACFGFVQMDRDLAALPVDVLALDQMVRALLPWAEGAFAARSPLVEVGGRAALRPEIAALLRAAYDPVMPDVAADASHALRLAARVAQMGVPRAGDAGG